MTSIPTIVPLAGGVHDLALVGGKAANLSRLCEAGLAVPPGFTITTVAYHDFLAQNNLSQRVLERVRSLALSPAGLAAASTDIRGWFHDGLIPEALAAAIGVAYQRLSPQTTPAVAVRSSATAEDLPELSFAGQQDTFLNVQGERQLLQATVECWSSLWTARAIGYRASHAIAHEEVALAVVVQQMVPSEASGVLFTANPLNGRRHEIVIDATLGLGEALVSGQVEPDHYVIDGGRLSIATRILGSKALSIRPRPHGGVATESESAADRAAVADETILKLARLGQEIGALFGTPQDVEWAWAGGTLHILQSRPITSLYPLPEAIDPDGPLQLYFSLDEVQGISDPITPLGQDTIKGFFAGAAPLFGRRHTIETQTTLVSAGERLFVNLTPLARHPLGRRLLGPFFAFIAPGAGEALPAIMSDPRFTPAPGWFNFGTFGRILRVAVPGFGLLLLTLAWPDRRRARVTTRTEALIDAYTSRAEQAETLAERVSLFEEILSEGFHTIAPPFLPIIAAGMASFNLLRRLAAAVPDGEKQVLLLTRGLPYNVTTEMDLALWRAAQRIATEPQAAVAFGEHDARDLADDYSQGKLVPPGQQAVAHFLDRYGMRGVAELDIGRPRWREDPEPLIRVIQSYLEIGAERSPDQMFARGAAEAAQAQAELVRSLRRTRGGALKALLVRFAGSRLRALAGLRESPKFALMRLTGLVREGLLASAAALVDTGELARADDIFYLKLSELRRLASGSDGGWSAIVAGRRASASRGKRRRQLPRLLLSDGQVFYEGLRSAADLGAETLAGSPVSPGQVEGTVRIVADPGRAQLRPGEILVCHGTDPAWTPLFLTAAGLVTEVGGLMTHGSVVAREYGIPAVVGVHEATSRLRTGQRVRLDGTSGLIVILDAGAGES